MPFQFTCPTGHLLEGDEAHSGQQVQCPICGVACLIPEPPGGIPSPEPFPVVGPGVASGPLAFDPHPVTNPDILHIPCPNGHELETPVEMLGQDVLCPYCQAQFQLHRKNSVEEKRKRQQSEERKERKLGKTWFNWAVIFVVLVVLGLIVLIATSSGD